VFKFSVSGATWIGASPELLVSLENGVVRAAGLAGSAPAGAGERLLRDAKELAEHAFVVEALRESLEPLCDRLEAPGVPSVVNLANISHLFTPFLGRARAGVGVLDLAASVHPTPAVAGTPRDAALAAIDRLEGLDRGWYAGPIGWFDLARDGEFAVALRSGLVTDGRAALYAGAGIVAGSSPRDEADEIEVKLAAMRDAVGGR
jgi:isochorismate synthase